MPSDREVLAEVRGELVTVIRADERPDNRIPDAHPRSRRRASLAAAKWNPYGCPPGGSSRKNRPPSIVPSRTVYKVKPDGKIAGPTSLPPTIAALTSERRVTPSVTNDNRSGACMCEPRASTYRWP